MSSLASAARRWTPELLEEARHRRRPPPGRGEAHATMAIVKRWSRFIAPTVCRERMDGIQQMAPSTHSTPERDGSWRDVRRGARQAPSSRAQRADAAGSSRSTWPSRTRTAVLAWEAGGAAAGAEAEVVLLDRDRAETIEAARVAGRGAVAGWRRAHRRAADGGRLGADGGRGGAAPAPRVPGGDGHAGRHRSRADPGRRLAGRALRRRPRIGAAAGPLHRVRQAGTRATASGRTRSTG